MKLQFKEQPFQLSAVNAVVKCFEGQPLKTNRFTLERSLELMRKAKAAASGITTLDFEVEELIGYRNGGIMITDGQILENIRSVQQENNLIVNDALQKPKGVHIGYNLTIEMETGTGKTYTYIRTMYELHKHYGWSKFIVIVPSIAIREGVYKTFEITQEHFQEIYGHKIAPFIYNSALPQDIETFASDSRISVMIINTQAFNASGADARRIYQEQDGFGTRRPIDIIAQTNPILIIDEPQSVEGEKTLTNMQDFHPLFTLRYSATHKNEYNKVYRLDALDAYNQKLVKKIQVKGINLKGSSGTTGYLYFEHIELSAKKPPRAVMEFEIRSGSGVKRVVKKFSQGDNLFDLSGGLPAYKDHLITEINGHLNKIVINGTDIYPGDVLNDKDELTFRRIQIRETINSHLQKEKELFAKGIKVLSLFFIDSVDKYRKYDDSGEKQEGVYATIFEEEYKKAINDYIDLFRQDYNDYVLETNEHKVHKGYLPGNPYIDYLKRDRADSVHEGYFSIDKKGKSVDPKVKRGSEDADDVNAYDLIMKDKERLLSFEEPTRFIFSHSALKEGWDNPNVFQICALKNVDSSDNKRRQEVGRGMRLCVDQKGVRQDFNLLGDQVHEINKLSVIASESYEAFAKGLQDEIAKTLKDRPVKADAQYFIGKLVQNEKGETIRLTDADANKINKILYKDFIIDIDDKITPKGRELIESGNFSVPEHLKDFKESIGMLLRSVYNPAAAKPEDERGILSVSPNDNFAKKEFRELWKKINLKTVYEVDFDTAQLVAQAAVKLDADLHISQRTYEIITGEQAAENTKDMLREGEAIYIDKRQNQKVNADLYSDAEYDLIGEIEARTNLKRSTVVAVLKKIKPSVFAQFKINPEEFIAKSSNLINEEKAKLILNHITYTAVEDTWDAKTVFTNSQSAKRNNALLKKHIYDYLTTDSDVEKDFAQVMEQMTEVVVYAKLPKTFYIKTPAGNYSPDWAIVFDREKVRHIYFVAETKGSENSNDWRGIEELKIHCAKEHFKTISNGEVIYDVFKSTDKLLNIAELK